MNRGIDLLQGVIHRFEERSIIRHAVLLLAGLLLFVGLGIAYNLGEARGFEAVEAMDAAQVARSLSRGEGFSTRFLRPRSLQMLRERQEEAVLAEGLQPDLSNAPAWPFLLSVAMIFMPFEFEIDKADGDMKRYQPEVQIGYLIQGLFFLSAIALFLLALRLFDLPVAVFVTALFLCTDIFWTLCFSGLSTHLCLLLLLCLMHAFLALRKAESAGAVLACAVLCGLLLAALMLTRYSLGCLILPVALLVAVEGGRRRWSALGIMLLAASLAVAPWLARNHQWSGHLFGAAASPLEQGAPGLPPETLERSLHGEDAAVPLREAVWKFCARLGEILVREIPALGGSWIMSFFLVGLLFPFRGRLLNRIRFFALLSLATLAVAQALGGAHPAEAPPLFHSGNLLILLLPLVQLFGAGLFFVLLDRLDLGAGRAQACCCALALAAFSLPLVFRFVPPRESPRPGSPHDHREIRDVASIFGSKELIMSDLPWAIAWYGDRRSVWLTRDIDPGFWIVDREFQKINGLYLTPRTTGRSILASHGPCDGGGGGGDRQDGAAGLDPGSGADPRGRSGPACARRPDPTGPGGGCTWGS